MIISIHELCYDDLSSLESKLRPISPELITLIKKALTKLPEPLAHKCAQNLLAIPNLTKIHDTIYQIIQSFRPTQQIFYIKHLLNTTHESHQLAAFECINPLAHKDILHTLSINRLVLSEKCMEAYLNLTLQTAPKTLKKELAHLAQNKNTQKIQILSNVLDSQDTFQYWKSLVAYLQFSDDSLTQSLINNIYRLGKAQGIPRLIQHYKTTPIISQKKQCLSLLSTNPSFNSTRLTLKTAFHAPSFDLSEHAMQCLNQINHAMIQLYCRFKLILGSQKTKLTTIRLIQQNHFKNFHRQLTRLSKKKNVVLQRSCLETLGQFKQAASIPLFEKILLKSNHKILQYQALQSLLQHYLTFPKAKFSFNFYNPIKTSN